MNYPVASNGVSEFRFQNAECRKKIKYNSEFLHSEFLHSQRINAQQAAGN